MISRLRGRIEHIADDHLIVDIGPIGITVYVPASLLTSVQVGRAVALYTYLHVREQEITLYGFDDQDELQLFHTLIGVSGVGPRLAINILSTLAPETIRMAVVNEEPAYLARVPGIGAKSARKILFHLKDKMVLSDLEGIGVSEISDADTEVIDALTSLGYSVVEAQRAVQSLPKDVVGVEDRLRLALSQMSS